MFTAIDAIAITDSVNAQNLIFDYIKSAAQYGFRYTTVLACQFPNLDYKTLSTAGFTYSLSHNKVYLKVMW
jgi:hypothetical protein